MESIGLVTLIVDDLPAAVSLYRAALATEPHTQLESLAFFQANGFVLGLMNPDAWEGEKTGLPRPGPSCIAINQRTPDEVDEVFARFLDAGASTAKKPEKAYWGGYSGYVVDPWGNALEIAHNPFWVIAEDSGMVSLDAPPT